MELCPVEVVCGALVDVVCGDLPSGGGVWSACEGGSGALVEVVCGAAYGGGLWRWSVELWQWRWSVER